MINTINGILEAAKGGKTGVIAVAAAHDQPVIEAVVEARKEGIATPILVGHVAEIEEMLRTCSRLIVMRDRRIVGELKDGQLTQDCVMRTIAGGGN